MSGINPVSTYTQPVNTTQLATTYKANIDACENVSARIVDQFAPRQTTIPAMTVTLDAGTIFNGTTLTEVATQTSGTITAPAGSNKRIDRAVISASNGTLSIITGTPTTGTPTPPAITAGNLPVAQIGTTASPLVSTTTTITNAMILDERTLPPALPTSGVTAGSYTTPNLTIGADGRVTSATNGASGVQVIAIQKFTGNGTYTPTSGMLYCEARVTGPGGNGGTGSGGGVGGGGGAGGTTIGVIVAATIGSSQTVTVPSGGSGSTASLGTLLTAAAGSNGSNGTNPPGLGGAGGSGGSGTSANSGYTGGAGALGILVGGTNGGGGIGGASFWGGGGAAGSGNGASGTSGAAYGSGGGGGGVNGTGGTGAGAYIEIIEYCT